MLVRVVDCRICLATFERRGLYEPRVLTWKRWSRISVKKRGPRVAKYSIYEVGPQKCEPHMLCALVSRRRLHAFDAVQKRHGVEPRVLYLLDRWCFQLLRSVIDVCDAFINV